MKKKERTTAALVDILFDELEQLVEGKSTPQQAGAKAKIANTIVAVKRVEIDVARFVADNRVKSGIENLPAARLAS